MGAAWLDEGALGKRRLVAISVGRRPDVENLIEAEEIEHWYTAGVGNCTTKCRPTDSTRLCRCKSDLAPLESMNVRPPTSRRNSPPRPSIAPLKARSRTGAVAVHYDLIGFVRSGRP